MLEPVNPTTGYAQGNGSSCRPAAAVRHSRSYYASFTAQTPGSWLSIQGPNALQYDPRNIHKQVAWCLGIATYGVRIQLAPSGSRKRDRESGPCAASPALNPTITPTSLSLYQKRRNFTFTYQPPLIVPSTRLHLLYFTLLFLQANTDTRSHRHRSI